MIDGFTKFVWLYPTKTVTSKEVISKLEVQQKVFGNPEQIVSDRGSGFTSEEFKDYCEKQKIKHHKITTGLPRANGQIERLNRVIIAVLSKASLEEPDKWYKYVDEVQQAINSTYQRSIATTPFELLTGVKMRSNKQQRITDLINQESIELFEEEREQIRDRAKTQLRKIQEENRKTYNLRRKPANLYQLGDIVAIKKTQVTPGSKLKPNFIGPYRIKKVKPNNTYDVEKLHRYTEGPTQTSTCAEFMKQWDPDSEDEILQDGRVVGFVENQI